MKILVTGGAGFIGNHLVHELCAHGYQVVVLDNLDPQVHGSDADGHTVRAHGVRFILGDVTDARAVNEALSGCDAVIHLAAAVGVGQSMYEVGYYTHNNVTGTACLYECLIKNRHPVTKIVVASSMSAYGEGLYECPQCLRRQRGWQRHEKDLRQGRWDLYCPDCGQAFTACPIPETEPFACQSIYALTKRDAEEFALMLGRAHRLPTLALRFFNVYGPGQSLANPYTGVLAIFLSRLLHNQSPIIYEDGLQTRDFVYVSDVARALRLALESDLSNEAFNVGSGQAVSIKMIGELLLKACGQEGQVNCHLTHNFRPGDIRHCLADTGKIRRLLYWQPRITLETGIDRLVAWARSASAQDYFSKTTQELERYGLLRPANL